jgi:hypothetical protein
MAWEKEDWKEEEGEAENLRTLVGRPHEWRFVNQNCLYPDLAPVFGPVCTEQDPSVDIEQQVQFRRFVLVVAGPELPQVLVEESGSLGFVVVNFVIHFLSYASGGSEVVYFAPDGPVACRLQVVVLEPL